MDAFLIERYKEILGRLSSLNIAADDIVPSLLSCKDALLQVQLLEPSPVIREAVVQMICMLQERADEVRCQDQSGASSDKVPLCHQSQSMVVKRRRLQARLVLPSTTAGGEQDGDEVLVRAMRCSPQVDGLASVVGLSEVKAVLMLALVLPCLHPQLFTGGRRPWTSVLLYGPPGTGKTCLAHAIAAEVGAELYCVSSAQLLSHWVGESEKMIQRVFEFVVKRDVITVVFMDEIDCLCRRRCSSEEEVSRRVARKAIMEGECADISVQVSPAEWEQLTIATEGLSAAELATATREALLLPVWELSQANYWRRNAHGLMEPCSRNADDAEAHTLVTLSADQVAARDVTFADFWQAVHNTKSSVTAAEMDKFHHFTDVFGQLK